MEIKKNTELISLTPKQIGTILEESKRYGYYEFCLLAISTGIRIGEILALTWNDINPITKTITINKSVNSSTKELMKVNTRIIRISNECCTLLLNRKERMPKDSTLIFQSFKTDTYLNESCVYSKIESIAKDSGIPNLKYNDFVHTYMTNSKGGNYEIHHYQKK